MEYENPNIIVDVEYLFNFRKIEFESLIPENQFLSELQSI